MIGSGLLLALLLGHAAGGAAAVRTLHMLVPTHRNFVLTAEIAGSFTDAVAAQSGGALKIEMHGPDVVPPFHQFEPAQAGAFDLLYTGPSYHSGNVPAAVALGGIGGSPSERRSKGVWAAFDRLYQRHGFKLIALPRLGTRGAQLIMRAPPDPVNGVAGMKIRATLTYRYVLFQLGATPVSMPGHDIYSALDRGVIDGAAFARVGLTHMKLHEVAGYMLRPAFGNITGLLLANLEVWEELSVHEQDLLLRAGRRVEEQSMRRFDRLAAGEESALLAQGMHAAELNAAAAAQLEHWFARGLWEFALLEGGAEAQALWRLAQGTGLATIPSTEFDSQ